MAWLRAPRRTSPTGRSGGTSRSPVGLASTGAVVGWVGIGPNSPSPNPPGPTGTWSPPVARSALRPPCGTGGTSPGNEPAERGPLSTGDVVPGGRWPGIPGVPGRDGRSTERPEASVRAFGLPSTGGDTGGGLAANWFASPPGAWVSPSIDRVASGLARPGLATPLAGGTSPGLIGAPALDRSTPSLPSRFAFGTAGGGAPAGEPARAGDGLADRVPGNALSPGGAIPKSPVSTGRATGRPPGSPTGAGTPTWNGGGPAGTASAASCACFSASWLSACNDSSGGGGSAAGGAAASAGGGGAGAGG